MGPIRVVLPFVQLLVVVPGGPSAVGPNTNFLVLLRPHRRLLQQVQGRRVHGPGRVDVRVVRAVIVRRVGRLIRRLLYQDSATCGEGVNYDELTPGAAAHVDLAVEEWVYEVVKGFYEIRGHSSGPLRPLHLPLYRRVSNANTRKRVCRGAVPLRVLYHFFRRKGRHEEGPF